MLQQEVERKEAEGEQAQRLVGEWICPNGDGVTGQINGSWLAWIRTGYDRGDIEEDRELQILFPSEVIRAESQVRQMHRSKQKLSENSQYSGSEAEQDQVQDPNKVDPQNIER